MRAVLIDTGPLVALLDRSDRGVKGLCLEIHDLLVSKAIAGREKI